MRVERVLKVVKMVGKGDHGHKGGKGGQCGEGCWAIRVTRIARVEYLPAHMVTTLPGNFFVTDFLSGASGHVIVTAEIDLAKE